MIAFHASLFPRDRIFARIDTLGAAPVVLVAAGAGSGKSAVVRDYLAARKVPHVRLDGVAEHAVFEEFLRAFASAFAGAVPAMASSGGVTAAQLAQGGDDDAVLRWAREHLAGLQTTVVLDDLHHALSNPRLLRRAEVDPKAQAALAERVRASAGALYTGARDLIAATFEPTAGALARAAQRLVIDPGGSPG